MEASLTPDIFPHLLIGDKYVKQPNARFITDNIKLI